MTNSPGCSSPLNQITNSVFLKYQFNYDPSLPAQVQSGVSNTVTTDAVCLYVQKFSNKSKISLGETLTFTIQITNNSTITVNNLYVVDTIPAGSTFVSNSCTVNGYGNLPGANPNNGIDLSTIVNNLGPRASTSLSFDIVYSSVP